MIGAPGQNLARLSINHDRPATRMVRCDEGETGGSRLDQDPRYAFAISRGQANNISPAANSAYRQPAQGSECNSIAPDRPNASRQDPCRRTLRPLGIRRRCAQPVRVQPTGKPPRPFEFSSRPANRIFLTERERASAWVKLIRIHSGAVDDCSISRTDNASLLEEIAVMPGLEGEMGFSDLGDQPQSQECQRRCEWITMVSRPLLAN